MTRIMALLGVLISFATLAAQDCKYSASFEAEGWTVHNPQSFDKIAGEVRALIAKGLEDNTVVFDTSGPILTDQSLGGEELLLDAMMFDNLETPRDEMFGDYAIIETVSQARNLVEVRWYNGRERNVVFNPRYLKCMSEGAPYALNSVL